MNHTWALINDYGNVFLRDRKLGKTYLFKYGYHHFTNSLLENLKDKFPSVNLVGIRLVPYRDGMHFARMYVEPESKEMHKFPNDWKKSRYLQSKHLVMMHTLDYLLTLYQVMMSLLLRKMQQKQTSKSICHW